MNSRHARVKLRYQGKDISADISGDLLGVSYEEGFGRADTVSVSLQDRDNKWLLRWRPKTGEKLQLDISVNDWCRQGDNRRLACGKFLVDELEYTAPPRVLALKGTSLPSEGVFVGTPHSRTWKDITIKDLILSMLPEGLTLSWQTKVNFMLAGAEQDKTPDLEYISGLCEKYGLRLKVLNNRLTVFDARELDAGKPVRKFRREDLAGYSFRHTSTRTAYDACRVKCQSAGQGKEISVTYPPGGNARKLLEVTESVSSAAEAEVVAKAALWASNIVSDACDLTLPMGDPALFAGRNIELADFGDFDGIYGIDASMHEVGNDGYQTGLTLHKVIVDPVPIKAEFSEGDTVHFAGGNHYNTAMDKVPVGGIRTAGTATLTKIEEGALHPYHLMPPGSSNVYGWVDASTVSKEG